MRLLPLIAARGNDSCPVEAFDCEGSERSDATVGHLFASGFIGTHWSLPLIIFRAVSRPKRSVAPAARR
jgi:hypothetical protein